MSWKWRTATEVLMDCGLSRPSKSDSTRAAMIIRKLNGDESKRTASSRLLLAPDVLMTRA
jgi:putative DNA primase/helicase